jgi:Domain of unknown function (DUF1906)
VAVEGYDCSWDPPDEQCAAAAGMKFVLRYTQPDDRPKSLSWAEVERVVAAGMRVITIHQPSGDKGWMLKGYTRGQQAAKDSLVIARGECGMDEGRPVYFALDVDPGALSATQWGQVRECIRGGKSVWPDIGLYGGYAAMERCQDLTPWLWQTYAWSGGLWHPATKLHQYQNGVSFCNGLIDRDRAVATDPGWWGLPLYLTVS